MKRFGLISVFPEMFSALDSGVVGRAKQKGLMNIFHFNPRTVTQEKNGRVDDRPYGGGPGMLMMVQPLRDSIARAKQELGWATPVIYLSPQGKRLDQAGLQYLAAFPDLILLAGRYEGIDQRVVEQDVDEEWSIGDYVLSGGEIPMMVLIDGLTRLIPGALGDEASAVEDSFAKGFLDCPHYTRPEEIDGQLVPKVLLSGDHASINRWRLKMALGRTWQNRPDLLIDCDLTDAEEALLNEFIEEDQRSPA